MITNHLRIQPGQEVLTPEQEVEAERFAQARTKAQFSTEPVDEAETEALLCQGIRWLGWLQRGASPGSMDRSSLTRRWHTLVQTPYQRSIFEAAQGSHALHAT